MRKVLVVHYSQSGQLSDIVRSFTQPLVDHPGVEVTFETAAPAVPYPFPWPFLQFFDTFPESVYLDPPRMQPSALSGNEEFDLIILAYQVWFLSPSTPITGFLQSDVAAQVFKDKPVVTLIGCRNMWLMAQEEVKHILDEFGARLVGNVVLTDAAGGMLSFFATPMWVLTGNKGPWLGGRIPEAGVDPAQVSACSRFGDRICQYFDSNTEPDGTLLQGLGAVQVNERFIASEKTARRGFRIWGRLLRSLGPSGSSKRKPVLIIYAIFLIVFICTFIPLSVLVKALMSPLTREKIKQQKAYFEQPSGH